ncbi:MAG: ketoacyl-ACP synthase III [Salibacteraceae bacterium]
MNITGTKICGIAASVPHHRDDNLELPFLDQEAREKLVDATGIRYRWTAKEQSTLSLCFNAANRILERLDWQPSEVEILLVVTQTPTTPIPGIAHQLQHQLGLNKTSYVLEVNQGCAGYIYGLSVAMSLMQSMGFKKGLLLTGDTITKYVSEKNHSLKPIFSDAATATALCERVGSNAHFAFGVNGERHETICLPSNGGLKELHMNGLDVLNFGLTEVVNGVKAMLAAFNETPSIDYLVMHQANKLLNDSIARKLGIPSEKVPSSLYEYGNTSSATIPLTISSALGTKTFDASKSMLLLGFGVGLSWGAAIVDMKDVICTPIEQC